MPPQLKRARSASLEINYTAIVTSSPIGLDSPHKSKKLKHLASYTTNSPYPDFAHPTPAEALAVHDLLSSAQRGYDPTRRQPVASNNSAQTCGGVTDVIEALIGTILSQNTSEKNSTRAKTSLDAAFGRNEFAAIAAAPRADVVESIRHGGLANKKAATIQNLLRSIKERHGKYSLQHLAGPTERGMSDDEIMQELVSYDGVGPKTASCVLLFCLGRDSFAVDTHVFRLSKLLGWVPDKADRILAQAHLDLKVPGDLKYGLHVLMVRHGRVCKGCKNGGKGACVLKTYLKERILKTEVVDH